MGVNRSERRRLKAKQEKSSAIRVMREEDIENLKNQATKTAIERMWVIMMSFPLLVLRDKYQFGPKRMRDFTNYLVETYNDYQNGYFRLAELVDTLRQETGVDLWEIAKTFEEESPTEKVS